MKHAASSQGNQTTRDLLVQAARVIFSSQGYHATGVQDITAMAGVAHGTFYLYFKSKKEIFRHLIDLLLEELYSVLAAVPFQEVRTHLEYESRLRAMTVKGAEVLTRNRDLSRILLWEAVGLDQDFKNLIVDLLDQFTVLGRLLIEHGQSLGFLRKSMDATTGARIVVSTVWGIAFRWAAGTIEFPTALQDVEELISELLYGSVEPSVRDGGQ
jgi:AcrR family transcriptional regulator